MLTLHPSFPSRKEFPNDARLFYSYRFSKTDYPPSLESNNSILLSIYRTEFDPNFHFQGSVAWKIRGNFAKGVSWKEKKEIGWGGIDRGPLEAPTTRARLEAPSATDVWRVAITVIQFFGIIFVLKIDD